eukprot:TRINITY_DN21112_c0_g1_i1.p1 TRINITY_DN21112_c0_g1~~TRINITY_DN21112_c0_g1_i1.p1  ORF type:complete len:323 (+),score=116.51 TRINITY_DN21112_c0_g1_i1:319-1287(+)
MASMNLEQLLAETLPTPPSTLDASKNFFLNLEKGIIPSPGTSRLSSTFSLEANPVGASLEMDTDSQAGSEHQVVPDISHEHQDSSTDLDTLLSSPEQHESQQQLQQQSPSAVFMAPIPDVSKLAAPPTRRQLRKRRQPTNFRGLDTSDDEDGSDPDYKRSKVDLFANPDLTPSSLNLEEAVPALSQSTAPAAVVTHRNEAKLTIRSQPQHHHDSDDEFGHEHLMSPEEEAELRRLLEIRQAELDACGKQMKGMTPAQKKRLRNKHASCVSRLKKKLYICNLVRELDKARDAAAKAQEELARANAIIAQLRHGGSGVASQVSV